MSTDLSSQKTEKASMSGNVTASYSDTKTTKSPNPTLDTIEMVEKMIKEKGEWPTKNQLWRSLPRQVQYPTFNKVLEYLGNSNKIVFDKKGKIYWIFTDNHRLEKLHEISTELK